jgi:hydroxyacylglutathione hydrolase/adenylyltransferase/sulfurtransferase
MTENAEATETAQSSKTELAPERVRELAESGEAELIDVRRGYEWEEGHLPGARQIEVNDLTAQADSIPKDRTVAFYCRSGNRSGMAATAFREAGYDAHNMAGGIIGWAEAGYPLEPEGGHVAEARPPSAEETG